MIAHRLFEILVRWFFPNACIPVAVQRPRIVERRARGVTWRGCGHGASRPWRAMLWIGLAVVLAARPAFAADTTAPTTPVVTDDGTFTSSSTSLHATWTAKDPESGIAEYRYQIRRDAVSGTTVVDWTSTGTAASGTKTLTLQQGVSYFFVVKAKNGAGLWSALGYSNGITVDTTAPGAVTVMDDGATTTSTTTLHATWTAATDAESGVAQYQYQIRQDSTAGTIVVDWTSTGTATSVTKSGLTLTVGKSYVIGVRAVNGAGLTGAAAFSDGITVQSATPSAFQESAGQVVIEAEHFDAMIARGGKLWAAESNTAGYSGVGSMTALPNTNVGIDTGYATTSPELQYRVTFATTGTYYIWIRGAGPSANDDSIHAGLDGTAPASADRISGPSWVPGFGWANTPADGPPATLAVSTTGLHTLNLWMREDGLSVDKILLRKDSSTTAPTGAGPSESPRTGALVVSALFAAPATRAYAEDGMTLSLSAMGPKPIEYQFLVDGAVARAWSSNPSYTWAAPIAAIGRHTVEAQARDAQTPTPVKQSFDIYVLHKPVGSPP